MPTPDEIRGHGNGSLALEASLALTSSPNRQPRPQLACPEDNSLTLSQWRQSVANSETTISPVSPSGESVPSPTDEKQDGPQFITSRTNSVDQKSLQLRKGSDAFTTYFFGPHSPLSLSHEFSSIRVCLNHPAQNISLDHSQLTYVIAPSVHFMLIFEEWRSLRRETDLG